MYFFFKSNQQKYCSTCIIRHQIVLGISWQFSHCHNNSKVCLLCQVDGRLHTVTGLSLSIWAGQNGEGGGRGAFKWARKFDKHGLSQISDFNSADHLIRLAYIGRWLSLVQWNQGLVGQTKQTDFSVLSAQKESNVYLFVQDLKAFCSNWLDFCV